MDSNARFCARGEKESVSAALMSDCVSLGSYAEYPSRRPFINTHIILPVSRRAVRAFPESSSAAIISALQNLQEKIRSLELQRAGAQQQLKLVEGGAEGRSSSSLLKQAPPSSAEPGCSRLELQSKSSNTQTQTQSSVEWKVSALEQDYQRLCETLRSSQRKIRRLESKLQEEEMQRRLLQDTTQQLQTGLEANRLLIQSVSPPPPQKPSLRKLSGKKPSSHDPQLHYRLSLGDVPFVTGTSTASSHSVRANVQRVLHLMKHHHPEFCNERVLGGTSSSSSSSASSGDELSELLLTLQDEFGSLSFEQKDLSRQIRCCVSDRLRQDLEREMEALVERMERKGEQIDKVRRHQAQMKKSKKERHKQKKTGAEHRRTGSVSRRVKPSAGDRSRESLKLLRDLRSLQNTLDAPH